MRPSLLPGLIAAARRNLDRGASSRPAVRDRPALSRRRRASDRCRCCSPARSARAAGSRGKAQAFDAFDAKAEVLALLEAAGAPVANLQVFADAGPTWHPGRSAKLGLGPKTIVASFGELHPRLAEGARCAGRRGRRRNLSRRDSRRRARAATRAPAYAPPALQAVTRDFAFVVPAELAADDAGPRDPRRRQGGDHRRPAVRPVRNVGRPVAGVRGHAAAGREELHRRARSARFRSGSSPRPRS